MMRLPGWKIPGAYLLGACLCRRADCCRHQVRFGSPAWISWRLWHTRPTSSVLNLKDPKPEIFSPSRAVFPWSAIGVDKADVVRRQNGRQRLAAIIVLSDQFAQGKVR